MPQVYPALPSGCLCGIGKGMNNKPSPSSPIPPDSDLSTRLEAIRALLEQQNGLNPVVIRLDKDIVFADALIIVSATSRRHARGLADALTRLCHERGYEFAAMEGYDAADWILVDCNDIIVNIFQDETRNLYRLEELWGKRTNLKPQEL